MLSEIQVVLGFLISFLIPGLLISQIFFDEMEILEKIGLGIAFSISISIFIGIFLGYNENVKNITGGVTSDNVWKYSVGVIAFLLVIYLGKIGISKWQKRIIKRKKSHTSTTVK